MLRLIDLIATSPAQLAQVQEQAEYERDCLALYCLVGPSGMPTSRFIEIVTEVAVQSSHEKHLVPAHLETLIQNNWLMAGLNPKSLSLDELTRMVARYPVSCSENCLSKFMALLGKEAELPKIPEITRHLDECMRDIVGSVVDRDVVAMFTEAPSMRRLPLQWSKETKQALRAQKLRRRQRRAAQRRHNRGRQR